MTSLARVTLRILAVTLRFSIWIILSMKAYSSRTQNTWRMHITTQVSTAVRPSDFGALAVTLLKIFTRTRNKVTSRAIRPEKEILEIIWYWVKIKINEKQIHYSQSHKVTKSQYVQISFLLVSPPWKSSSNDSLALSMDLNLLISLPWFPAKKVMVQLLCTPL